MSKYTCATHKDNPNWICFESNGMITHVEGEIQKVEHEQNVDLIEQYVKTGWIPQGLESHVEEVNAFIEAVREDISIGIVEVEDSDLVQFGVIKELAKKHLGWDENKI